MNILGEGFNPIISKQIDVRQKLFGAGFNTNNPRNPAFISYARTPTSFVRLMSSVSIGDLNTLNNPYIQTLKLSGTALAKKAILFGGIKGYGESLKSGITDITQTGNQSIFNDFAYGWGGTEYGLRPMPGIQSANIKNESLGSLKTSTVQIKAWNKSQFEIIDILYLRLGFYVMLEWGHTVYINNSEDLITNVTSLENEFFTNNANIDNLQKSIIKKRYDSCGNYDAILGRVVNFSWTFNKDGSYDITLFIRSLGDVIESLKANVLTTSPEQLSNNDQEKTPANIINPVLIITPTPNGGELQQQQQNTTNTLSQSPSNQLDLSSANTTNLNTAWSNQLINSPNPDVNKSNIHARLYKLKNELDQKYSSTDYSAASIFTYLSDNKLQDVAFATFQGKVDDKGNFEKEYYIRFGALLRIIQGEVIPTIYKGATKYKLLNIDYDESTNLINFIDLQVSTDPSKLLIKRDIQLNNIIVNTFPGVASFVTTIGTESYGKLMNVYLNYNYVFQIIESLIQTPGSKVVLVSFLQSLGDSISKYLGGINNIVPIIDEDTNTVKFIDQNLLFKKKSVLDSFGLPTTPGVFDLYGYNASGSSGSGSAGFIKDFNLKTELTPAFASMITIAAAARSKGVGEDATALSRLNAGLTSSLFEQINDEYIAIDDKSSLDTQYKTTVSDYVKFLESINMIPTRPKWDPAAFNSYSLVLNNFINYAQQLKVEATSSATTSTGFIPINVSLNMTGMSGMKIYQEFNLKTDFLPSNYQSQMSWLIKGVNHTIENNMWSTTIESLSLPNTTTKPDSFEKLANITRSKLADATKSYLIPISYKSIVEKIIARAKELIDGIDKGQLTAILTVAQAESNLNASKTESFKYDVSTPEGITRVKTIFSNLKNKTDEEIKNIFSNPQTAATFVYGKSDSYLYRGRGLAQVTGFDNYEAADNLLESLYNYTNPYYGNLVKKPEEALIEFKAIDILILSKREGTFGTSLNINKNYITDPIAILETQNQGATDISAIVNRYTEALNSINQTKWIQELLNKK